MSSAAVSNWDNEYAKVARVSSQLRTEGLNSNNNNKREQQFHSHLQDLNLSLNSLPISTPELHRRRRLIQNMQDSTGNTPGGAGTGCGQAQTMARAMEQQDNMIDELAVGVSRLRDQTQVIGDEARMHVNLLNDMETNLDAAHVGLESETRRAAQLKEDQSVWRLQLTVAGLSVLLVLLILMGLS